MAGKRIPQRAECVLVGFDQTEQALLAHWILVHGATCAVARSWKEMDARAGQVLTLWNIPEELAPAEVSSVIRRESPVRLLFCMAPPHLGAGFCLERGAGEAVGRPWDVTETLERIRRAVSEKRAPAGTIRVGDFSVATGTGEVRVRAGKKWLLTGLRVRRAELNVLNYLAKARPRYVSTTELQRTALGVSGDGAAVRFHIRELRRQLGTQNIESWRGLGYRLKSS